MKKIARYLFGLFNIEVFPVEDERFIELTKIEGDPNHVKITVYNKRTGEEIFNYRFFVFNEKSIAQIRLTQQKMASFPWGY